MENLNFWLEVLGAVLTLGWVLARLIPSEKNRDLVETILTILGKLIPNKSKEKDENGNFLTHIELKLRKRIEERKKDK